MHYFTTEYMILPVTVSCQKVYVLVSYLCAFKCVLDSSLEPCQLASTRGVVTGRHGWETWDDNPFLISLSGNVWALPASPLPCWLPLDRPSFHRSSFCSMAQLVLTPSFVPLSQWCAGKCLATGSLGGEKVLIWNVCQCLWCKYLYPG